MHWKFERIYFDLMVSFQYGFDGRMCEFPASSPCAGFDYVNMQVLLRNVEKLRTLIHTLKLFFRCQCVRPAYGTAGYNRTERHLPAGFILFASQQHGLFLLAHALMYEVDKKITALEPEPF